jgi:alpha-beta hydrolase superfamily lysophospholipase
MRSRDCLTLICTLCVAFSFQGCSSLFFYPDKTLYTTPSAYSLNYDDIYFSSDDNTSLHAWHIYPDTHAKGLLLVAHGNAQNLSSHFTSWLWMIQAGYELFIFDYRGYGRSQGSADISGSIKDTKSALAYIEGSHQGDYFVCGQSLGGTMLLNALNKRDNSRIKSVIIDSTFTGFSDIVSDKLSAFWLTWPFQWIPYLSLSGEYDAKDRVGNINIPLLFVHGSLDTTISANNSWQLFELSSLPREIWIVKNTGHTQAFSNENVQKDLLQFLQENEQNFDPNYSRMKIYE